MAKGVGFLLLLATVVNLSYSQTVTLEITPDETVVGKAGKLKCSTTSTEDIQTWIIKKESEILIQYDKSFQFTHPSLTNRVGIKGNQVHLEVDISPVKCEDDGNYSCIIKQELKSLKSENVNWVVRDSPQNVIMSATFIDLKTDAETDIIAGKSIHLLCQAELGNPAGEIEWYIAKVGSDEEIKESNYEKTTVNVTTTDAKAVKKSCQMSQKSSIKFYTNSEMKLAIRCQVKNAFNSSATERFFKIIKEPEIGKVSSTLIIIIILAVIIPEIIIAIILGIVLYIRRKRQKKKRELEAAQAEEKAAMPDRNSFQMKPRGSSKGGRRKRDSSLKEKADAPEKQAMTGYRDDPEACIIGEPEKFWSSN